jgi:hypothetical protein
VLRPLQHVKTIGERYPDAWRQLEHMHLSRRQARFEWDEWCYVPLEGALGIVTEGKMTGAQLTRRHPERVFDAAFLSTFAAWRATKGVYRFDPDIFSKLCETKLTGELPSELFYRMPEWCVYIETPGLSEGKRALHGFYTKLDHNPEEGRRELHFVLDLEGELVPHRLPLGGSLESCVAVVVADGVREPGDTTDYVENWTKLLSPLVSLLLYLCSEKPDVSGYGQPGKPKRIKGSKKLDVPKKVRHWDVAFRLGASLRSAEAAARDQKEHAMGGGETPRPHIRRAHWHLYWTGPKGSAQTPVLRWLSPILVAFGDDPGPLPAVIRTVPQR